MAGRVQSLQDVLGLADDTHGFEAYYNIALTPATRLTLDCQVLDSPAPRVDTAVVLGMRFNATF